MHSDKKEVFMRARRQISVEQSSPKMYYSCDVLFQQWRNYPSHQCAIKNACVGIQTVCKRLMISLHFVEPNASASMWKVHIEKLNKYRGF